MTIPKEVRDKLGLTVGDEMEAVVEDNCLILRPLKLPKDPVLAMLGIASGNEFKLKDYEEAVAKELKEKLERSQ